MFGFLKVFASTEGTIMQNSNELTFFVIDSKTLNVIEISVKMIMNKYDLQVSSHYC